MVVSDVEVVDPRLLCTHNHHVQRQYGKDECSSHVLPPTSLWSVAQGEDEASSQGAEIEVLSNGVDKGDALELEGGVFEGGREDAEEDVEVGDAEPGKADVDEGVEGFDHELCVR